MSKHKLSQSVLTVCYEEVAPLLELTVRQFRDRYGGGADDLDDLRQQACLGFVRAYQDYREERGAAFSTWVRNKVWYWLLTYTRSCCRDVMGHPQRGRRLPRLPDGLAGGVRPSRGAYPTEWLQALSGDARLVVDLILSNRPDLRLFLVGKGIDPSPAAVRRAMERVLADFGWEQERVCAAFEEVRQALEENR